MAVNDYPLVSIITPVCNGSEYLEDLIQSVLNQDYPNIEHLIVDDGSQDSGATISILRKYPHVRWWSQANQGQYATMNAGLAAAQGKIVCFVNADDCLAEGAVKAAVQRLMESPRLDGVFGITHYIDQRGNDYSYWIPFCTAPISFYPYFAHISHCSLYVRKEAIQQRGLSFDPSLRFVGDYEWIIRIYRAGLRIGVIRRELSKVRIHIDQASQRNREASMLEAQLVLKTQRINGMAYMVLSTFNVFLLRIWKVCQMLKNTGVRGVVTFLAKRNGNT